MKAGVVASRCEDTPEETLARMATDALYDEDMSGEREREGYVRTFEDAVVDRETLRVANYAGLPYLF